MARLMEGQDPKIDKINKLVWVAKFGSQGESSDAITELLAMFKPMMLGTCKKWSDYFNDSNHSLIPFNDLLADCAYWFSHYTIDKYVIDGKATYNKFITDHINQRIRYIFEKEIKYQQRYMQPSPRDKQTQSDAFDEVITRYASDEMVEDHESVMMIEHAENCRSKVAQHILAMIECNMFTDRERDIFIKVIIHGKTHEELGIEYGISRTRITQILAKIKDKLYKKIEGDGEIWQLLDDADISITNPKLME